MRLFSREWGSAGDAVVCVHGVGQHGGIYADLGERLAKRGLRVVALDLRGHGDSGPEPPWDVATHVSDVLETVAAEGIGRAFWVGHSFGGLVSATLAAREPEAVEGLALLDPGLAIDPAYALASAEVERLDWAFETVDSAVNALLSSDLVVAAPRDVVAAYAEDDLERGPDGRLRFSQCPSAVVTAWSETTLPAPPVARVPTLLVRPEASAAHTGRQDARYRSELGPMLTLVNVPNGHNVLWESADETIDAIESFVVSTRA